MLFAAVKYHAVMAVAEKTSRSASATPADSASGSPEWQLVQRIIASPAFVRSTLLTNFLLYVCDRKLRGKEDEITEHQIGVHALRRPENYHPGEDNIVRNYARMLRKRLEEFFEGEGHIEELRILIPRGQYVPRFERAQSGAEPRSTSDVGSEPAESALPQIQTLPQTAAAPSTSTATSVSNRRNFIFSASAAAVGASALGWIGMHEWRLHAPAQIFGTFWSQLFSPKRDCFVVTGDSGLVLLHRLTGREISLNEYVDGTLASDLRGLSLTSTSGKGAVDAGTMHYTSTADLKVAIAIDRLAMSVHAAPQIRNAREMRMVEVKSSNCIFIGGPRANPWITLFEPRSNFQMKFYPVNGTDHTIQSIWNKHPKPGEQQEYLNSPHAAPYTTYTMVSFLPSIDDNGWVLVLQGQQLSGTGAAGEFVTNVSAITPVLKNARKSDGSIGPFEVILETQAVGTDAPRARVVVERYDIMKSS